MQKLSKLTNKQLDKMLLDTQAELKRRQAIADAASEIHVVLNKHALTIDDFDISSLRLSKTTVKDSKVAATKKRSGTNKTDNRMKVAPKYKSLDGTQTWTGRGRAPKWVAAQCNSEGISVDTFKKDKRFAVI